MLPALLAAATAPPLKITKLETVYWKSRDDAPFWPHWTWLKIHTDAGVAGIGETYPRNAGEAEMIHSHFAPALLGKDPRDIERIWNDLYNMIDFQIAGGAEMRTLSAIDLALWDLLGHSLNTPAYRMIGGRANPRVRIYNTCFPHKYDFLKEPVKIMRELIDQRGVRAIKIWPFDTAARQTNRQYITQQQIAEANRPIAGLPRTVGDHRLRAAIGKLQDELCQESRRAAVVEPLAPERQNARIPAIAKDRADGV